VFGVGLLFDCLEFLCLVLILDLLDLLDDLCQELLGVINAALILISVEVSINCNELVEQFEELHGWSIRDLREVLC
jgi:hypothetical protein